jgi:YVTN family beta-propeller protein
MSYSLQAPSTPDGVHAEVTNLAYNNLSVIDVGSNTVVATIPVGSLPFALAFDTVTPQSRINALIATIQSLVNAGTLTVGQGDSLIVSLQHALRSLPGQPQTAISQLQTFIGKVNTLVSQHDLTEEQGQPLIDSAQAVIHSLGR